MSEGRKDDQGKLPWHLAPWDAFGAIVHVLAFGAEKYAPRNWERGMSWSRPFSALQRHLAAWWEGECVDPETGMSHLWHAGCCIIFLIAYELRGCGTDDRPATVKSDLSWADLPEKTAPVASVADVLRNLEGYQTFVPHRRKEQDS